jgi:hypothetical protein
MILTTLFRVFYYSHIWYGGNILILICKETKQDAPLRDLSFGIEIPLNILLSIDFLRNGSGRFGAVKSYSTSHFFGNACTKSGPLRFSQFSGFSVILLLPLFPCNVPCRVFSYDSHLFPVYSQNVKYISTGTISKCPHHKKLIHKYEHKSIFI